MASQLVDALARGALVVTPNKRLSREIVTRFDVSQRECGRAAWPAARAMPWHAFVGELWQQALDAGAELPPHRLDDTQGAHLWRSIVAADLADSPLVDPDATAALAAEAWSYVHAYGAGGQSWRGFDHGEDPAAFARWAEAFVRETAALAALDEARAVDAVAGLAAQLPGATALDVVLAGFLEVTPQQQRLLDALQSAGASVVLTGMEERVRAGGSVRLAVADSPREELILALSWVREHAGTDAAARVAVVVPDLAQRREEVRMLAEDTLCPALQWPDALDAARPFDVSAPLSLAEVPIVATALQLITMAQGRLDGATAAALLRSPYLPGGEPQWRRRARFERDWLESGKSGFTWLAMIGWLDRGEPLLAQRWREARASVRLPSRASPRDWAVAWRALLEATGWCEGRALSSEEFQARRAWGDALTAFVSLGAVAPALERGDALNLLRRTVRARPFQPESNGARVQILGLLEAAGLSFDALWVTGMSAQSWPQAPSPNPLLPIAWQRERGVPRSHPARELDHARRVTAVLANASSEVVFSYPARCDDHACAPSPLVAMFPLVDALPVRVRTTAEQAFDGRAAVERRADAFVPSIAEGAELRGGAYLIDAQSACPFQAALRYRLAAKEWPQLATGLTQPERGTLVHGALESFWNVTRDHARLVALSEAELDGRIAAAVETARAKLEPGRWETLPAVVAAGEGDRITRVVRQWLVEIERPRPPFTVVSTECRERLMLAGITLEVTFDRLDRLGDGTAVIVDYKSGRAVPPARWFDARPQGAQLALYALAYQGKAPGAPLAAVAYAQVRPGEAKAVGIAADPASWPALVEAGSLRGVDVGDWEGALARWSATMEQLAHDVVHGEAGVSPRDTLVCSRCHLQPVCRIAGVDPEAADAGSPHE